MVFFNVKSDVFLIYKKFLKIAGIWPLDRNERGSTIIFWTTTCLQIVTLISRFIDPLGKCPGVEFRGVDFGTSAWLIFAVTLQLSFRISASPMVSLIESTMDDWSSITDPEEREIMIRHDKYGFFIAAFQAISEISAIVRISKERLLLIPGEKAARGSCAFHEDNGSPWVMVEMAVELIVISHTFVIFWSTKFLHWSLAMHLCSQYKILQMRFQSLLLIDNKKESRRVFRRLVKRHNELLVLTKDQENSFNVCIAAEILTAQLALCINAARLTAKIQALDFIGGAWSLMLMISPLIGIYINYYAGDYMTACCEEIGEVFTQCNWYDLCKEFRINYSIVILRCRMPTKFTAMKIYKLNLSNFKYVLEALYSYISLTVAITKGK